MKSRTNLWKAAALVAFALITATAAAQEYYMYEPSVTTCQGAFLDSQGNGGPYQDNENFTTTICSDGTGPAISLQWIIFNLSTAGTSPLDQMSIYDGTSTSDPLIGTWQGSDNPGIISASFANITGCLTLVFTSNGSGTGEFAAAITCFQPCQPPVADATVGGLPVPLLVCQGEDLTFDGNGSYSPAGFTVSQWIWNFADGSVDSTSGPVVTHNFDIPAEYVVQLTVVDDNDCASVNNVDQQVLVSTTPEFIGTTADTTICQGQAVDLTAVGTPVNWSALPESTLGNGIFLPDLQGVPFSTALTFSNFAPGQTLTNINDLESVCVSMEHSFMGDLVIQLTCPSGQTVVFHQQGGGTTYLGIPVDDESDTPGVCWEYCWSPTATNGTWVDNTGGTLPSGTYESLQPFSTLQGCDLNGVWTFTITDLFAIDNGYICDWGLNFNPGLFPSLTSYTPVLGLNADSCAWTGPNSTPSTTDPLTTTVLGVTPGVFDYTFTVTDNFGCTYDTTITVTVSPSPQGPIVITGDAVICEDGVAFLDAPLGFDSYLWSPNGDTGPNVNVGAGTYTVTVAYGNCPLTSGPFVVTELPAPVPVITGPAFSCGGQPAVLGTTEPYASYLWSTLAQSPTITVGTGSYTVIVTTAQGCSGESAPFDVQVGSSPNAAFGTNPNSPQPMGTSVTFNDASSVQGGTIVGWNWSFGDLGGSSDQSPTWPFTDPDTYEITLIVTANDGCTDTISTLYVIFPPDITIPNVISPNGDNMNDFFVIDNIEFWSNQLTIFGRWGNKVYEVKNYVNQWKADELPDGTYYYVLTLNDGKEHAGHITVLR